MINKTEQEIMENWVGDINNPLVSIKCTAYNHEKYISDALDGFLIQETTFPFEVIIHDDASTDNTAKIIKEYEKKYPKIIKPIYETENQYSKHDGSLRRIINKNIKGKYVADCEGDDYWISPFKLQKQAMALENNTECSISYCYVDFVDIKGNRTGISTPPKKAFNKNIITLKDFMYVEFIKHKWCFHTSSFFYRSSLLDGYEKVITNEFKDFPYGDLPIRLWCLLNGNGFLIRETMSCYRQDTGGYMSSIRYDPKKHKRDELSLIKALKSFDKYTNEKYKKYVKSRIKVAYLIIMAAGRTREDFLRETIKPRNWKISGFREVIKNFVIIYFPRLFKVLDKIKQKYGRYR